jgi:release factor glutamine methyltransferase
MIGEPPPPHVAGALRRLRDLGLDAVTAQRLLLKAIGKNLAARSWLISHDTQALTPAQWLTAQALAARVDGGEPLAYVLGEAGFWGLTLRVNPAVLIPRPDTETLAQWALELTAAHAEATLADLGTGSGALALTLAQQRPHATVWAVERSPQAMAVAQHNAQALALSLRWCLGDWWAALPQGLQFDLVVSNPPYLAGNDKHLAELGAEPQTALVAGPDGLRDFSLIIGGASRRLRAGGWLLLEHGHQQAQAVAQLLHHHGLQQVSTRADLAGRPRCTGGQRR